MTRRYARRYVGSSNIPLEPHLESKHYASRKIIQNVRTDIAKRIEMKEQLLEIFSSLTEDQSEALIFYYLLGYSVKEIASMTGKPDATIYTLLRRGRERLQDERAS